MNWLEKRRLRRESRGVYKKHFMNLIYEYGRIQCRMGVLESDPSVEGNHERFLLRQRIHVLHNVFEQRIDAL